MDPIIYLKLCVELKDLLLRKKAKEVGPLTLDYEVLEWMKSKLGPHVRLSDLVIIHKATVEAIRSLLHEEADISKSNESVAVLSER